LALGPAVKIRRTWGQSAGKAQELLLGTLRDFTFRIAYTMTIEPQWIVGFVDGEGCFHVGINEHSDMSAGYQVLPEFTVVQHERDVQILHALKDYFGCGVVRSNHRDRMAYRVRGKEHLLERIIPFFEKHELKSKKRVDFQKFRKIVRMMGEDRHLTSEGIEEIRRIKSQMNRGQSR
jgi:hypothetical protein